MSKQKVLPPQNIEAEEGLLSAILVDEQTIFDVPNLEPQHFYSSENGLIFQVMKELVVNGIKPDMVTVSQKLEGSEVDQMKLLSLASEFPAPGMPISYSEIVIEAWRRRQIIKAASSMAQTAYNEKKSLSDVLSESTSALVTALMDDPESEVHHVGEVVDEVMLELEAAIDSPEGIRGILLGFPRLDEYVQGLKEGEIHIIAGRPGMGKTQLANNFVENIAQAGHAIMFFSLEMSRKQLIYRIASQMSGVPFMDIYAGRLVRSSEEYERVMMSLATIKTWRLYIDDSISTASQMFIRSQRQIALTGVDVVFVDYLQIMAVDKYSGNRAQDVSMMSQGLKLLAKKLSLPVVVLAQLNREVEKRDKKLPRLSDLKDSGKLEEDASIVLGIYNPAYYYLPDELLPEEEGKVQIPVLKNRYGKTGITDLGWIPQYGKFTDNIKSYTW